jgi:hypothetical protein
MKCAHEGCTADVVGQSADAGCVYCAGHLYVSLIPYGYIDPPLETNYICGHNALGSECPACREADAWSKLQRALERIASGSPSTHAHNGGDHSCAQCAAYIDEARDALGWARLPAQARTPA